MNDTPLAPSAAPLPEGTLTPIDMTEEDQLLIASLPIHEHLGLTQDRMESLCRQIWERDAPLAGFMARIDEQNQKSLVYLEECEEHKAKAQEILTAISDLRGKMRALDAEYRVAKGAAAGARFRSDRAKSWAKQTAEQARERKKFLYVREAKHRLDKIGKQLRFNRGARASKRATEGVASVEDKGHKEEPITTTTVS